MICQAKPASIENHGDCDKTLGMALQRILSLYTFYLFLPFLAEMCFLMLAPRRSALLCINSFSLFMGYIITTSFFFSFFHLRSTFFFSFFFFDSIRELICFPFTHQSFLGKLGLCCLKPGKTEKLFSIPAPWIRTTDLSHRKIE